MDALVASRFKAPRGVIINSTHSRLYAGSAVLHAYYGDEHWHPTDVDICMPYGTTSISKLARDFKAEDGFTLEYMLSGSKGFAYGNSDFSVIKVRDMATSKCVCDIVLVYMDNPKQVTKEQLHAHLVEKFDIKICSLAWDGKKLYYPPATEANMITRTSRVIKDCPAKRIVKYVERGFMLGKMALT